MVFKPKELSINEVINFIRSKHMTAEDVHSMGPTSEKFKELCKTLGFSPTPSVTVTRRIRSFVKDHLSIIISSLHSNVSVVEKTQLNFEENFLNEDAEARGRILEEPCVLELDTAHDVGPQNLEDVTTDFEDYSEREDNFGNFEDDALFFETHCLERSVLEDQNSISEEDVSPKQKQNQFSWKGDSTFIGKFSVSAEKWEEIYSFETETFSGKTHTAVISKVIRESRISYCIFNFYQTRINKKNIVFYCYCSHPNCLTFKVVSDRKPAKGHDVTFSVSGFGTYFHEPGKVYTRAAVGSEQQEYADKLENRSAFQVHQEAIKSVPTELVLGGNAGDVKSMQTLRKIKSKRAAQNDLDTDVMKSMIELWKRGMMNYQPDDVEKPDRHLYILSTGVPMHSIMASIEELQMFLTHLEENLKLGQGPSLRLDATSSVVSRYLDSQKGFFYALCFSLFGKIVTLSSAILSQHTAAHIAVWFQLLKAFLSAHQHWPIKNNLIVIDGSYPLLYAVLDVFNKMSLIEYLEHCYKLATCETFEPDESITIVRTCCAHKMKNFSDFLSSEARSIAKNTEKRRFVMQCFGTLFMCTNYETAKSILKSMFILFLNPNLSPEVKEAEKFLSGKFLEDPENELEEPNECDFEYSHEAKEEEANAQAKTLYERSPSYRDLKQIFDRVKSSVETYSEDDEDQDDEDQDNEDQDNEDQDNEDQDNVDQDNEDEDNEDQGNKKSANTAPLPNCASRSKKKGGRKKRKASKKCPDNNTRIHDEDLNLYDNKYYCPNLAEQILKRHCPTLFLWTGIIKRKEFTNDPVRFSNSIVECLIKIVKVNILGSETNLRLDRFCETYRNFILNVFKEITLKLIDLKSHRNPRPRNSNNEKKGKINKKSIVIKKKYKKTKSMFKTIKGLQAETETTADSNGDFPPTDTPEEWARRVKRKQSFKNYFPAKASPESKSKSTTESSVVVEEVEHTFDEIAVNERPVEIPDASDLSEVIVIDVPPAAGSHTSNLSNVTVIDDFAGASPSLQNHDFEPVTSDQSNNAESIFLPNGLNDDPQYYKAITIEIDGKETLLDYKISNFNSETAISFANYDTLNEDRWFSKSIMDTAANLFISETSPDKFTYVSSHLSCRILDGENSNLNTSSLGSIFEKDFIVMFYLKRGTHWCFILVDIPHRYFYILDPMMSYSSRDLNTSDKYKTNFIKFSKSLYPSLPCLKKVWKIKTMVHPLQSKFQDCGPYSLFYLFCIVLAGKPVVIPDSMLSLDETHNPYNPTLFRIFLKTLLLRLSDNVRDLCPICFEYVSTADNLFIKCEICQRVTHCDTYCKEYFSTSLDRNICRLCYEYYTEFITSGGIEHTPSSTDDGYSAVSFVEAKLEQEKPSSFKKIESSPTLNSKEEKPSTFKTKESSPTLNSKEEKPSTFKTKESSPTLNSKEEKPSTFKTKESSPTLNSKKKKPSTFKTKESSPTLNSKEEKPSTFKTKESSPTLNSKEEKPSTFKNKESSPTLNSKEEKPSTFKNKESSPTLNSEEEKPSTFKTKESSPTPNLEEGTTPSLVEESFVCEYEHLFYFLEPSYTKISETPRFYEYIPPRTTKKHVSELMPVALYFARNPFPSPQQQENKPWCFFTLPNGTIDNLNFYIQLPEPLNRKKTGFLNYSVAKFQFPSLLSSEVTYDEFSSLDRHDEAYDSIVDIMSSLLIKLLWSKNKKLSYLNIPLCREFMNSKMVELDMLNLIMNPTEYLEHGINEQIHKDSEYVVTILHEHFHFCLIVIDVKAATLLFLDSLATDSREKKRGEEVVAKFSALARVRQLTNNEPLRLIRVQHPRQRDGVNCGIFCLFFLEMFLCGKINDLKQSNFDPESYRITLKKTLLWHSEDISQNCCTCNIINDKASAFYKHGYNFVECQDCERCVHIDNKCLLFSKDVDLDSWEPTEFYCPLCRVHRMKKPANKSKKASRRTEKEILQEKLERQRKNSAIEYCNDTFPLRLPAM